ncbi:toll-like receptor 2 [Psammomys obesus]|uniref:toll-like receptor 2 n=1 Tax=Psammomys obesus TaxID=48139 RepID=UPI0024529B1C|nr:toll-like receptor 2 [Psammomys obesus]XP_055452563.1 toll-like receptor 2 [Psammomys obesus]
MIPALWTFWTLLAMTGLSKEGCCAQVPLSCDTAGKCDGRSRSFTSIPSGLTAAMKSLDLSNNKITYIGHEDLRACVSLRALMLESSGINTIEDDAFSSLGSLEHLDLSDNHLSNLSSSWFRPLSSLKYLNLMGNPYRTLGETSLFSSLTKLQILRVGNADAFSGLRRIDFLGLTSLDELEIKASGLRNYEPKSLKAIQDIHHLTLHLRESTFLLGIFADILSSVRCLELRETSMTNFLFSELSVNESTSPMKKLAFRNAGLTDKSFNEFLKLLPYISELSEVEFDDCTLNGIGNFNLSESDIVRELGKVETLTIRRLHIPNFYLFYDLRSVYSLLQKVKRITVENSKVFLVPCLFSQNLKSLEFLDLSENLMVEEYLKNSACEDAWPALQTLILRQNHLRSIERTGEILLTLKNLTALDISRNSFGLMPDTCQWPEKMRFLNLSSTGIQGIKACIPPTLEVLDVSNNKLNSFSLLLPRLRELHISRNKLKTLPDASFLPVLLVMKIRENAISTFSEDQLSSFPNLESLEAGANHFICSCEFLSFTLERPGLAQVLVGWPDSYLCDSPPRLHGQRIQDARPSVLECHQAALVSGVCCALLLMILLIGGLCYHFHGLWYLRMMWAWLQAKRKPKRAPCRDVCYDAFVSYSEQDSHWVEHLMVQQLENGDPPFKLCLHKRDFVPGKWIIDNIIDSIEKSHKTVFVLSENFVRSEWCKYELDFSHFRLFEENNDATILVLLEPIEKKAIPQRFCKLRKIMNTKTYLEWPLDDTQQEVFWTNLRTAIKS